MPKKSYKTQTIRLPWTLPTIQPIVALLQLKAEYRASDDGTIAHADAAVQAQRLIQSIRGSIETTLPQFIVLPEYSCPKTSVQQFAAFLEAELPSGTACILPLEHITAKQYIDLLASLPISGADSCRKEITGSPSEFDHLIVNVALSFVKTAKTFTCVPQLKLRPAALEETTFRNCTFYGGSIIRILRARNCNFAVLICFDLIAKDEGQQTRPRTVLVGAGLNVLFVPECNPEPLNEQYAKALISLYDDPSWSNASPVVIFANVAASTILPQYVRPAAFGFSRLIGDLGETDPSQRHVLLVRNGTLACDTPASLSDLEPIKPFPATPLKTVVVRPSEALVKIQLSSIGQPPSKDPAGGRFDMRIEVFRSADKAGSKWSKIRSREIKPGGIPKLGVPVSLVQDMVGISELELAVEDLIRNNPTVWLTGDGGSGKTALAASVLYRRIEEKRTCRVLWIDMAGVSKTDESFLEEVLFRLGKAEAIKLEISLQWNMLATELKEHGTVLVLDSLEWWRPEGLPPEIFRCALWPSRLLVTSRVASDPGFGAATLHVSPLDEVASRQLVTREAGGAIPDDLFSTIYSATGGSPLGWVWLGGLMKTAPELAPNIAKAILESPPDPLRTIFEVAQADFLAVEKDTLAVLSELPASLAYEQIAEILETTSELVRAGVVKLRSRNMVSETPTPKHFRVLHTRHPFIRQFWEREDATYRNLIWTRVVSWARTILQRHGGDRNWSGYPQLAGHWPNIRYVLEQLCGPRYDPALFLSLWREADYFLWTTGRWRERIEFGEQAKKAAEHSNDQALLAHALYDSIAETKWHRRSTREEVEPLLDDAQGIFAKLEDTEGLAMVAYYRGRMLRRYKDSSAVSVARGALELARTAKNDRIIGLALNGLGRTLHALGELSEAASVFEQARPLLEQTDRELLAAVHRNFARVKSDQEKFGDALQSLDESFKIYDELGLDVEYAETIKDHSMILARLGEFREAAEEANQVHAFFSKLGAVDRLREVETVLAMIPLEHRNVRILGSAVDGA